MEIPITFQNHKGQKLSGTIHKPKKYSHAVIVLHGFPSSQNGSTPIMICRSLEKRGILAMRFSFTACEDSEGDFSKKLLSEEVKDVKKAIDFLAKNYPCKSLTLLGHSTGATVASLYSYKDKRIDKLVLLGALSDLKKGVNYDFDPVQVRDFWAKGYIKFDRPDKAWLHKKKLKKDYYDEFFKLNIEKAIKKYCGPLLIIHGEKDEAIPLKEAKELFRLANQPKKLIIMKNSGHKLLERWNSFTRELIRFIKGQSLK